MTSAQQLRYRAAHLLALCASGTGETLSQIADQVRGRDGYQDVVALARRAINASLGAGNWRQQRGEAEAKLRCGERV